MLDLRVDKKFTAEYNTAVKSAYNALSSDEKDKILEDHTAKLETETTTAQARQTPKERRALTTTSLVGSQAFSTYSPMVLMIALCFRSLASQLLVV